MSRQNVLVVTKKLLRATFNFQFHICSMSCQVPFEF